MSSIFTGLQEADQQTVYMQVKGLVDQLDKRGKQNVSKALKKTLGIVTEEEKEADYGPEYQAMVKRVGQMAKEGPRKTVWDPVKKVYKTVPINKPKTDNQDVSEASYNPVTGGDFPTDYTGGENFNGIDISMEIQKDDEYVDDEDYDNQVLYVTASSKGKELGHVLFAFDGEYLMPQDLEVEERYRGQGIAQIMYDYVKSKGYKIRRSGQQTDAGAGFWDKHKPGKNVWEQGVAEGKLNELFEPTLNYYKLSNGKTVQASYRPNVNQSPVPFTDVSVSYVNPALKPQGPSFDSTGVAEPWTSAPDGVKQAIQKFVTQPQQGVAEGYEPPTSAKGSPAYRASLLRKKQERHAAADAKKKQQGVAEGSEKRCMQCGMKNCKCPGNSCKCKPIAGWVPGKGFKKAMEEAALNEKWSQKYKSSINCSHPKGFSQKAHCAGKKKHNEDITMEHVCPDCGMCQTHGNLNEIKKGQKDSNGYTRCWPGKHAEGTKTGKNGGQVRKCVPNESVDEAAIAINMKKHHKKPKGVSEDEELDGMALGELTAIVQDTKKIYHSVKNGTPLEAWMYKKITNSNEALTAVAQQINNPAIRKPEGVAEEKIKGADGKACWPGYRYNGTENGKDSCVKVKETKSNILKGLMG